MYVCMYVYIYIYTHIYTNFESIKLGSFDHDSQEARRVYISLGCCLFHVLILCCLL